MYVSVSGTEKGMPPLVFLHLLTGWSEKWVELPKLLQQHGLEGRERKSTNASLPLRRREREGGREAVLSASRHSPPHFHSRRWLLSGEPLSPFEMPITAGRAFILDHTRFPSVTAARENPESTEEISRSSPTD